MRRNRPVALPELSRFELQCLRRLWKLEEASVRQVQMDFPEGPGYSTFRKIFERLEEKGAILRVRREGRAWVYRSAVPPMGMIRREVRRLLDGLFEGRSGALLAHLADMQELTLEDLREVEKTLSDAPARAASAPVVKTRRQRSPRT
jgi:predicted transcriptional regulator